MHGYHTADKGTKYCPKGNSADFLTFSPSTVCGGAGICVLCANQLELEKFYLLD
jgi:hypothetical protein